MKLGFTKYPASIRLGALVLAIAFISCAVAYSQGVDKPDPVYELGEFNGHEIVKGEALVQFTKGVQARAMTALHAKAGCEVVKEISEGLFHVRISVEKTLEEILGTYAGDSSVEYAEPNLIYRPIGAPSDPYWSQQWGPKKIKCAEAWDTYTGDPSALVAILDTGVDMDHVDLNDHYAGGYDYYSGDSNPNDTYGHGTITTGIAAAETNNGIGVAGVAYNCRYLAYRVGHYSLPTTAIVQGINAAKNNGALSISMSFGGSYSSSIYNALNSAYNAGCVCVAAAGNGGSTQKLYPAGHSIVMGVASSNQYDNKSSFSSYGSWVDVAAPGENIVSTYYNGGYASADGTSMSCPHVAGMAVILYAMQGGTRTKANADDVIAAIRDSAVNVGSWVQYGRVDLDAAMDLIAPPAPPQITNISPSTVQAFLGGIITITGNNFISISEVNSGGTILTSSEFTVVDTHTITYSAPTANALGNTAVTVKNASGTSNPGYFTYVETNPPKLQAPLITGGGSDFTWEYGGGVNDYFYLIVSANGTTFTYKGFPILLYYTILYSGNLDSEGTGELMVQIPTGYVGLTFYSQVVTYKDTNYNFAGSSNIETSVVLTD